MQLLQAMILFFVVTLFSTPTARGQNTAEGGLKAEIIGVNVSDNRRPTVTFKIGDSKGKPLDLDDLDPNSVKFTIAVLKTGKDGEKDYHNYILNKVTGKDYVYKSETRKPVILETMQPDSDQGGSFAHVRPGVYAYTFKTTLPAIFDRRATHVVGGQLTRGDRRYAANPLFEFVPAGGKVQARRELAETATCNKCHDPMRAHRGTARETGYCALCHTAQLFDPETDENLDFKYLVHKLHRGKYLPSVKTGRPYITVGLNQRVADFSTIVSPQSVVTETIPKEYRNCAACHANPKASDWKTLPSSAGCVSCHDNVDLRTGKNHGPGPAPEGTCVNCHQPEGPEFGPSIIGAHTFPGNSIQLPGTVFDILKIEDGKPGSNPVVTFSLKDKKGEPLNAREASPRRKAVKIDNCNVCHLKLQPHGEQRNNTEFCVMCHNASHTDEDKRKTAKGPMPPESVHYKRLIHRIHTGRNLGEPFIVYRGPAAKPVPIDLGEIRFPGDRRNCLKCHEKGANELPLPAGVLATSIPQADGAAKLLTPIMSACIGCHTNEPAKAHMEAQAAAVGRESCVVCHGVNREFSVEKVHRR